MMQERKKDRERILFKSVFLAHESEHPLQYYNVEYKVTTASSNLKENGPQRPKGSGTIREVWSYWSRCGLFGGSVSLMDGL